MYEKRLSVVTMEGYYVANKFYGGVLEQLERAANTNIFYRLEEPVYEACYSFKLLAWSQVNSEMYKCK